MVAAPSEANITTTAKHEDFKLFIVSAEENFKQKFWKRQAQLLVCFSPVSAQTHALQLDTPGGLTGSNGSTISSLMLYFTLRAFGR